MLTDATRPPRSSSTAVADVATQYGSLPYPRRRAADELHRRKPIHSSLGSIAEVAHHVFGGRFRRRFCASPRPFRVLVAGGGTGDVTVQLAQELADAHDLEPRCGYNRSQLYHLDLSAASVAIASARLRARRLRVAAWPPQQATGPVDEPETPTADDALDSSPEVRLLVASSPNRSHNPDPDPK